MPTQSPAPGAAAPSAASKNPLLNPLANKKKVPPAKKKNFFSPTFFGGLFLTLVFVVFVNVFGQSFMRFGELILPGAQILGEWINFYASLLIPPELYLQWSSQIYLALKDPNVLFAVRILLYINIVLAFVLTYKSIIDNVNAFFGNGITSRAFILFLPLLKRRKQGKPWGVVYDSVTKAPIDPATVEISTWENGVGEYKQTRITDINGRFSFLITPGRYVLTADKTHYTFPSKIVKGTKDGKFENVYHGEVFEVENPYIINLNIPMDPAAYDWNQAIKTGWKQIPLDFVKEKGRPLLIFFGVLTTILGEFVLLNGLNFALFTTYLLNALFFRVYIQKELWGTVKYRLTGDPVVRVTVRAIRQPLGVAVGSATTDYMGRYFLLMSQGLYTLQVEEELPKGAKPGEKPKILAKMDNVNVKKGKAVINLDITV